MTSEKMEKEFFSLVEILLSLIFLDTTLKYFNNLC